MHPQAYLPRIQMKLVSSSICDALEQSGHLSRAQERLRGNALEGAGVSVDTPERSGRPKGVSGT